MRSTAPGRAGTIRSMTVPRSEAGAVTVREPAGMAELRELEGLQLEVWGFGPLEAVPAAHLRAVQHAGGMVLGAYRGEAPQGFAYGFPALPHDDWEGGTGIHSHMVAVRPGSRGIGVGRALKWAQRAWCLERGIGWMTWTFDPIQARNARLNFHHLGVLSHEYLVDFYGPMPGELGGGQPSDRLVAFWNLRSREVTVRADRFAIGLDPEPEAEPVGRWLLAPRDGGDPTPQPGSAEAAVLRVAVPADATRLLREDPASALRWRMAVREALAPALEAGFVVSGFAGEAYTLERRRG